LWKLDLPYIWGPIAGANNISLKLLKALPLTGKIKLLFRAFINTIQLNFNRRIHNALKRADVLLTATTENQTLFKRFHDVDSFYLPENCINRRVKLKEKKFSSFGKLHFVWIGSIEARKALKILLDSLLLIENREKFIIDIIGDGPLKNKLQNFASQKGLDNCIIWHGKIPRNAVIELLNNSYLNIITSVSEANPTTIWEAMSVGVPTISIDHCGMHDIICSKCGIKIKLFSYNQVVQDFATEIIRLVNNPIILKELSEGVIYCTKKYLWRDRKVLINQMYKTAIYKWNQRKNK